MAIRPDIAIVSYHSGMHGSIINLMDLQQYLRDKGYFVKFYCKSARKFPEIIKLSKRPYKFDEIKTCGIILERKNVVITDFKSINKLYEEQHPIVARKIVVFDNVELSYHLLNMKNAPYYQEIDLEGCLNFHKFNDVEFLMPPCNYQKFIQKYPNLMAKIFYKKINPDMLRNIKISENGKTFYRNDSGNGIVKSARKNFRRFQLQNVFCYSTYYYRKRKDLAYFEQFGRLVFEFVMLGKNIEWEKNPLLYEDGLTDYILYYGLEKEKLWKKMEKDYEYKPWKL